MPNKTQIFLLCGEKYIFPQQIRNNYAASSNFNKNNSKVCVWGGAGIYSGDWV